MLKPKGLMMLTDTGLWQLVEEVTYKPVPIGATFSHLSVPATRFELTLARPPETEFGQGFVYVRPTNGKNLGCVPPHVLGLKWQRLADPPERK